MTEEGDIDGLAAEYVLGSLDPAERKNVDARRRIDTSLDQAIEAWQRRLAPLSEQAPDVAPRPDLFANILSQLSGRQTQPSFSAEVISLRSKFGHRRRYANVAGTLAACLAAAVVVWFVNAPSDRPTPQLAGLDCAGQFKDVLRKLDREKYAKLSAEQLAGVSRMALRAYDACQAGDESDADTLFGRLRRMQF